MKIVVPDMWGHPHPWPTIEGDTRFAKKFNDYQKGSYEETGKTEPIEDLILQMLIDDYNSR